MEELLQDVKDDKVAEFIRALQQLNLESECLDGKTHSFKDLFEKIIYYFACDDPVELVQWCTRQMQKVNQKIRRNENHAWKTYVKEAISLLKE